MSETVTTVTSSASNLNITWFGGGDTAYRHCGQCGRRILPRGWASHKVACDRRLKEWREWCGRGRRDTEEGSSDGH